MNIFNCRLSCVIQIYPMKENISFDPYKLPIMYCPENVKGTLKHFYHGSKHSEKLSEYDQEIPQSHTADQPTASEEEPQNTNSYKTSGRQLKQSNQLSLSCPRQDNCKTRKDTKKSRTKHRPTQNPHKQYEVHKTMYQQQQNHCLRTDRSLCHWGGGGGRGGGA